MSEADKEAVEKILLKMYRLSKELCESNEPILWELGHYLIDNLLSKNCMYDAMIKKKDEALIFINSNKSRTKDFPNLYKDILQTSYSNVPDYDTFVKKHHGRRNIFQHSEKSLDLSIRKEFVEPYLSLTEGIMRIIGIVDDSTNLEPSDYLKKEVEKALIVERKEIPDHLDPNEERLDMLKALIDNLVILHYTLDIRHEENRLIRKIVLILSNYNSVYRDEYMRSSANRPEYRKIIANRFGLNFNIFSRKIVDGAITAQNIKRKKMIYAGDLALIFSDHYEKISLDQTIKVDDVRKDYEHELLEYEYFKENFKLQPFSDALKILEDDYKLIELLGEKYKGSNSNTEAKILDFSLLKKFGKRYSINYYLRKIYS